MTAAAVAVGTGTESVLWMSHSPLCVHVCPFIKQIALIHSSAHQSPEHLSSGAVGSSVAEMTEWRIHPPYTRIRVGNTILACRE